MICILRDIQRDIQCRSSTNRNGERQAGSHGGGGRRQQPCRRNRKTPDNTSFDRRPTQDGKILLDALQVQPRFGGVHLQDAQAQGYSYAWSKTEWVRGILYRKMTTRDGTRNKRYNKKALKRYQLLVNFSPVVSPSPNQSCTIYAKERQRC